MWEDAATKYKEQRSKYAEDDISWLSRHIKKKYNDGRTSAIAFEEIPDFQNGEDFATAFNREIETRRNSFHDMRVVGAGVADAMLALSMPLKALLDQASSIGGMVKDSTQKATEMILIC